jgi:site-specific DNA-methyltransferase (adenine-specific)
MIINMDCREGLKAFPDASFDSIVTDPPYELGFMGKSWDSTGIAYNVDLWREALRVLKPGGHLLSFSGSRTYHRMACAIEDAGFEIRDSIMWVYGSGFPKSLDVSKAIDKAAGAEREVVGAYSRPDGTARQYDGWQAKENTAAYGDYGTERNITAPATPAAQQWQGWGTALKPAHEPICVARKPLVGTVAANVLQFGTGALNIDGCRVPVANREEYERNCPADRGQLANDNRDLSFHMRPGNAHDSGRWPANLIHDGLTEDWARFFYCAKASRKDRNEGLTDPGPQFKHGATLRKIENTATGGNNHPTVKPTELMRYLCRLVTPPGGSILDPFAGSGSTGKAAVLEGFVFIGFELDAHYAEIANARMRVA